MTAFCPLGSRVDPGPVSVSESSARFPKMEDVCQLGRDPRTDESGEDLHELLPVQSVVPERVILRHLDVTRPHPCSQRLLLVPLAPPRHPHPLVAQALAPGRGLVARR